MSSLGNLHLPLLLSALLGAAALPLQATEVERAAPDAVAATAVATATAVAASTVEAEAQPAAAGQPRRPAPNPASRVIEDDHVRIEELRVRGQLKRVTVQSKIDGVREYEIIVGHGGRDPSQDRGNAGRSAWRFLSF